MKFIILKAPDYNQDVIGEKISTSEAALFLYVEETALKQRAPLADKVSARGYVLKVVMEDE